jgi:hypothetical protein
LVEHSCAQPDPICVPPQALNNHLCLTPPDICVAGSPGCTKPDPNNPGTPSNPTPGTPCIPGSINCSDSIPSPVTCKPGTPGCTVVDPNNLNLPGVPCVSGTPNCTGTVPTPCDPLTTNCSGDGAKEATLQKLSNGSSNEPLIVNKSTFDTTLPLTEKLLSEQALETTIFKIKTESSFLLHSFTVSAVSMPVIDYGVIHGVHVSIDFNRYLTIFETIGSVFIFLASCLALFIVLG